MSLFYVKLDEDRFVKQIAKEVSKDEQKDWTELIVPTVNDIDFSNRFDKYQVTDTGALIKGGEDTTTLGDVNQRLAEALDVITKMEKTINAANDSIEKLNVITETQKQLHEEDTKTIAGLKKSLKTSAATIKQLQTMAIGLTKARAKDAKTIAQLKDMLVKITKQMAHTEPTPDVEEPKNTDTETTNDENKGE